MFIEPVSFSHLFGLVPTAGKSTALTPAQIERTAPAVIKPDPIHPSVPVPQVGIEKLTGRWHHLSDPALLDTLVKIEAAINLRDPESARSLLTPLAGSSDANVLFYFGIVERERAKTMVFWQKAADLGHPSAMNNLAAFLPKGDPNVLRLLEKAAALGEYSAALGLGNLYRTGNGVAVDVVKGARYTQMAAELGNAEAMSNLGGMYMHGVGVAPDPDKARHWFQRSALAGHPGGQYNYALALLKGIGDKPDFAGFLQWAQVSADKDFLPAMYRIGVFYARPDDGRPPDFALASTYLKKCAVKNSGRCLAALGVLTERGQGVTKDGTQALVLYALAVHHGHQDARQNLMALQAKLPDAERNAASVKVRGILGANSPL